MPSDMPVSADADYPTTERSRVRRLHQRGSHTRADVHAILDASPLCHVGYVIDGAPYVTPTLHWRNGERVYWHGSAASRFLRQVAGQTVCLTCSLMDGYVLARSAFNHSVNYRSAMVFGTARIVEDDDEKTDALRRFTDGLFPNRCDTLRPMTAQELKATSVLWMDVEEATAKVRAAPPGRPGGRGRPGVGRRASHAHTARCPQPAPELPGDIELPGPLAALIASGRLR